MTTRALKTNRCFLGSDPEIPREYQGAFHNTNIEAHLYAFCFFIHLSAPSCLIFPELTEALTGVWKIASRS